MKAILMLTVLAVGFAASAETVLWYSFDEGTLNEKTVSGGTIVNKASNGDMAAVPHALTGNKTPSENNSLANWATYAEGFDGGWHVYDPVSRTTPATADRSLDFAHAGGSILTVANDARLRSQPMTVEMFVRFQTNAALNVWNVFAVQPTFMPCANADAWGLRASGPERIFARFTPPQSFTANVNAANNVEVATGVPDLRDDKWHHIAFSVDADNTVKLYFDYVLKTTKTLAFSVQFSDAEDCPLMIGATQQTSGVFTGRMNEFRLSNAVLEPGDFLRAMGEEPIADLDSETLIWYSFGADMIGGQVPNRASLGRYPGVLSTQTVNGETFPKVEVDDVWGSTFRSSFDSTETITNRHSLYNAYGDQRNINACLFAKDLPDVFTNSSFTIECMVKADGQIEQYTPFVRRYGGGNVQLNLGVGATVGTLSAVILPENTDASHAIQLNDSVRIDDGAWHHVALVRDAEAGKVHLYRDYSIVATKDCTTPLYPTTKKLLFAGTDAGGNVFKGWMDEARITLKALGPEKFFTNRRVVEDGEVRSHVTFDETMEGGVDIGTVSAAKVGSGSVPTYSDDVPAKFICDERGRAGKRLNAKSLRLNGGVVKYQGSPWIRGDEAQTIEFFVKGEAQSQYTPVIRFGMVADNTGTPVWSLSTASGDGLVDQLMTRWDVLTDAVNRSAQSCPTGIVLFDGKWHHVALTFAPNASDSAKSDVAVWKDYVKVYNRTFDGRVAYNPSVGMLWLGYNGTKTFTGWIDELRITKGVIGPEKFLRAENFSGLMVIFK